MSWRLRSRLPQLCLVACIAACGGSEARTEPQLIEASGEALGTTWTVRVSADAPVEVAALEARVERVLDRADRAFSTWRDDAEIARFDAQDGTAPFPLSAEVRHVVSRALHVARETGGAFDPTVRPLVALWGFGAGAAKEPPDAEALEAVRGRVGWRKLQLTATGLGRTVAGVGLDLSAIAKGWAVDQVLWELASSRYPGVMVEVGGEVAVSGTRPDGTPWRLGVEVPTDDPKARSVHEVVRLTHGALATSGDYRQARKAGGRRVSHIIDPATGRPVPSRVAAASVIAPTCAEADAVATALMVMPPEDGMAFVEERPWLEALLVLRDGEAVGPRRESSGWARYR